MNFKERVKSIQTSGYNGARMVDSDLNELDKLMKSSKNTLSFYLHFT